MSPIDVIAANALDIACVAVDDKARPAIVDQKKPGIGLHVVLYAELDKDSFLDRHTIDQPLQNSVLAPLGKDAELCVCKRCCVRRLPRLDRAERNLDALTARFEIAQPLKAALHGFEPSHHEAVLFLRLRDDTRGISSHYAERRGVTRHHRGRADNRAASDPHALQDRAVEADPGIVLDDSGRALDQFRKRRRTARHELTEMRMARARRLRMRIIVVKVDAVREEDPAADVNVTGRPHPRAFADVAIVADADTAGLREDQQFAGDPAEFADRNGMLRCLRIDDAARRQNARPGAGHTFPALPDIPQRFEAGTKLCDAGHRHACTLQQTGRAQITASRSAIFPRKSGRTSLNRESARSDRPHGTFCPTTQRCCCGSSAAS